MFARVTLEARREQDWKEVRTSTLQKMVGIEFAALLHDPLISRSISTKSAVFLESMEPLLCLRPSSTLSRCLCAVPLSIMKPIEDGL